MQLSIRYTLWLLNIAMENDPFIDDVPIKMVIFHGYVKSSIRDGTFTHESSISNGGLPAHYQFMAAKLLDVLLLHMPPATGDGTRQFLLWVCYENPGARCCTRKHHPEAPWTVDHPMGLPYTEEDSCWILLNRRGSQLALHVCRSSKSLSVLQPKTIPFGCGWIPFQDVLWGYKKKSPKPWTTMT